MESSLIWDRSEIEAPVVALQACSQSEAQDEKLEPALIVIVDDDKSVRKSLVRLMKSLGLSARAFESGEDFLNFGSDQQAACLILDLMLPGMNGLELQRRLAFEHCRLPIVFISAHENEEAKAQAIETGAIAFLGKPFSEADLLKAIRSTLN